MPALPIVYLPGAAGRSSFWRPVGDRLCRLGAPIVLGYPGFGDVPPASGKTASGTTYETESLDGYYRSLLEILPARFHLVAQSMGNVLALRLALETRADGRVASLVLCALTGGVDVRALGGTEWRDSYRRERASLPQWFADDTSDFTQRLPELALPVLALSGDADPLSPPAVGTFLAARLPNADAHIVAGGTHSMAEELPDLVADRIGSFLLGCAKPSA